MFNTNNLIFVYRLKHPNSGRHYVGITNNLKRRLKNHLYDKDGYKKCDWIKSHWNEKELFYMEPFYYVKDCELAKKLEIYWIAKDREKYGHENIMNGTDGGDGLMTHTPESRKKMSDAGKGKRIGEKNSFYGKSHTPEAKKKMGDSRRGRKHTEETKKIISEKHKGKRKPLSEETKRRISEALKRKNLIQRQLKLASEVKNKSGE